MQGDDNWQVLLDRLIEIKENEGLPENVAAKLSLAEQERDNRCSARVSFVQTSGTLEIECRLGSLANAIIYECIREGVIFNNAVIHVN